MKRKLSALVLTVFLATSTVTPAFAADNTVSTKKAGITPDSILYPVDRAIEAIQLALTSSDIARAKLLAAVAEERLAETQAMLEKNKVELAKKAADDYDAAVEKADDEVEKAADKADNTKDTQKAAELKAAIDKFLAEHADSLKKNAYVLAGLIEKLPEEAAQKVAANIVRQTLHFEAVKNYLNKKKDYNDQKKTVQDAKKTLNDAKKEGNTDAIKTAQKALDDANSKLEELADLVDDARIAKGLDAINAAIPEELKDLGVSVGKTDTNTRDKTQVREKIKEKIQNAVGQAKKALQEQHKEEIKAKVEQKTQTQTKASGK